MGTMLELTAADGHRLAAYRAEPGTKARGAIIVVQEIFGVNSHIKAVTEGFAADGFLAIAPALFDRLQRNVDLAYGADDIAKGRALKEKSPTDAALLDVQAACNAVKHAGKIGVVGYCWGGYITWMAAAKLDGLACAVPYYGGGILENANAEPRCPLMAHFGERDSMIPVAGVRELAAQHPKHQVFIYAADHGFNCDHRGSFDASSAALARERTLAFFRLHVG